MGNLYHIYCDESRQSHDRFMVLGGLLIEAQDVPKFHATMQQFREETRMFAELKWSKVSQQKLAEYRRFLEYFFALLNTDQLHHHCLILDNHQINHRKFNKGDKELGFYKFYYQLLLHSFGHKYCRLKEGDRFLVHLDQRQTHYKLGTLKTVLNHGMRKRYQIPTNPFRSVEPKDSKKDDLIQLTDLILGAIGFEKNGYDLLPGAKASKKDLVRFIAAGAGLPNLKDNSPRSNQRFTIWNFRLQK